MSEDIDSTDEPQNTPVPTPSDVRAAAELELRRRKADMLKKTREQRLAPRGALEVRAVEDGGTLTLRGLACRTGVFYDVAGFSEMVAPGAFRRTLGEDPDVQLVVNHAMGGQLPLARTRSGTMRLNETTEGLEVEADLDPEDPDAQRLARALRRGDIDGMSFAFTVTNDSWSEDMGQRTIRSLSLHRGDVSVCNQGANPSAFATIRSLAVDALASASPETVLHAFVEWRDHTLVPVEQRAGATLSAATMEVLSQVLALVATADDAVDGAQPLLAELMGVPNPDADEEPVEAVSAEPAEEAKPARDWKPVDQVARAREQLMRMRAREQNGGI